MRKLSITILSVLLALPALACKPKPLEQCQNHPITVSEKSFAQLLKKIKTYQGQLDKVIRYPQKTTPCFNNHFAGHYGDAFLKELKKNKGKTCEKTLSQVESSFWTLASPKSDEFKAIAPAARDHFEDESDNLQDEIKKFFSGIKRK